MEQPQCKCGHTHVVEPFPGPVVGQVAVVPGHGQEAEGVGEAVEPQRLDGHPRGAAWAGENLGVEDAEAEGPRQGPVGQREGEVPAGQPEVDVQGRREVAVPHHGVRAERRQRRADGRRLRAVRHRSLVAVVLPGSSEKEAAADHQASRNAGGSRGFVLKLKLGRDPASIARGRIASPDARPKKCQKTSGSGTSQPLEGRGDARCVADSPPSRKRGVWPRGRPRCRSGLPWTNVGTDG